MSKPIDISPEAVRERIVRLESLAELGWIDGDIVDLVSLSPPRSAKRGGGWGRRNDQRSRS